MMDKRWRKLDAIAKEHGTPWRFGSEIGRDRHHRLGRHRRRGARGGGDGQQHGDLRRRPSTPRSSSRIPDEAIRPFIQKHRVVIVLEENQTGQYANFLQSIYGAELGFKPERINKYDGAPFRPDDVLAALREVAAKHGIKTPAVDGEALSQEEHRDERQRIPRRARPTGRPMATMGSARTVPAARSN